MVYIASGLLLASDPIHFVGLDLELRQLRHLNIHFLHLVHNQRLNHEAVLIITSLSVEAVWLPGQLVTLTNQLCFYLQEF